jgi:predicted N-formylglutamate amidohydrolase
MTRGDDLFNIPEGNIPEGNFPDGSLIEDGEPPPLFEERRDGASNFLIMVDHGGALIPRRLKNLGLLPADLRRHIAWDIGALAVARGMAAALDARLVAQNYSRLVIDCNRDPAVPSSIPTLSEATQIPGNIGLSAAQAAARRVAIFDPYHDHVRSVLDERKAAGRPTFLVAQHTMTNIYQGMRRDMHAAVLYNRDRRFAGLVLDELRREAQWTIADNQPYFVSDATDYTIPRHGEARGLPHVEIEIRQDLVTETAGQLEWAQRMSDALRGAERIFFRDHARGGN